MYIWHVIVERKKFITMLTQINTVMEQLMVQV